MEYIDDTLNFDILEDNKMAYQTGLGLAKFHATCSDIDLAKLENTIKDFHDTKKYIDQLNMTIKDFNFIKLDDNVNKRVQNLIDSLSNPISFKVFNLKSWLCNVIGFGLSEST